MITFKFRPIERWPQNETPDYRRRPAHFRISYPRQLAFLSAELEKLGAKTAFIQADVTEADLRLDGQLRSDSKPRSPRIIVAAETRHGWISLPCDSYRHWKDNLYAIALSLEALRAVDRHGVTQRGEQYRGLKQLTAGDGPINAEEAASVLLHASALGGSRQQLLRSRNDTELYYRAAARRLHPDAGGDRRQWDKLQAAIAILRDHFESGRTA